MPDTEALERCFLERRIDTLADEAETLASEGDLEAAIRRLRSTCVLALEHLGRKHPGVPDLLRRLAALHRHNGQSDVAESAFLFAREIDEENGEEREKN